MFLDHGYWFIVVGNSNRGWNERFLLLTINLQKIQTIIKLLHYTLYINNQTNGI